MSTIGVIERGGGGGGGGGGGTRKGKYFPQTLHDGTQIFFFKDRVKIEKDTMGEGVTEKDTRIEFGIELVGE